MSAFDRDLIRGGHYGQRPRVPQLTAEHMAAPTNAADVEESSCQPGAVHTWHIADKVTSPPECPLLGAQQTKGGFWPGAVCPLMTHERHSLLFHVAVAKQVMQRWRARPKIVGRDQCD